MKVKVLTNNENSLGKLKLLISQNMSEGERVIESVSMRHIAWNDLIVINIAVIKQDDRCVSVSADIRLPDRWIRLFQDFLDDRIEVYRAPNQMMRIGNQVYCSEIHHLWIVPYWFSGTFVDADWKRGDSIE